jgi:predicted phosphodiesterase
MTEFSRRQFGVLTAATLAAQLTRSLWAREVAPAHTSGKFYFALIADTHIIDDFYLNGPEKGAESNFEDNDSILHSSERLRIVRDLINSLTPKVDQVFVLGDYFHNYPSTDYEFYFKNKTRLDNAKELTDGFRMPVHIGFGNHDYAVRKIPREMAHRLFKAKFGLEPYYAVDHNGVKFVQLSNFLGSTQDKASADFKPSRGSFGLTQLEWLEAQLRERKQTYIFLHYPLGEVVPTEKADFGLHSLLRQYKDSIQLVVSGHKHKWIDYERQFGPRHIVMAATRYDPNALMLLETDTKSGSWRWLNASLVEWNTHYAKPYRQG